MKPNSCNSCVCCLISLLFLSINKLSGTDGSEELYVCSKQIVLVLLVYLLYFHFIHSVFHCDDIFADAFLEFSILAMELFVLFFVSCDNYFKAYLSSFSCTKMIVIINILVTITNSLLHNFKQGITVSFFDTTKISAAEDK